VGGISGLFKSIKKKITLKGVIKTVAGIGGAIPVIGGAISTVANIVTAAKGQATQAASAAQETAAQQLQQSASPAASGGPPGTFATSPAGPQPQVGVSELAKNPLVWIGVGIAALFLLRRR